LITAIDGKRFPKGIERRNHFFTLRIEELEHSVKPLRRLMLNIGVGTRVKLSNAANLEDHCHD
jgi:hypothetical protein